MNFGRFYSYILLLNFPRHIEADNALHEAFRPLIDELSADQSKINTNPLEIYKYAVGEPPAGMSDTEAAQHPQVVLL